MRLFKFSNLFKISFLKNNQLFKYSLNCFNSINENPNQLNNIKDKTTKILKSEENLNDFDYINQKIMIDDVSILKIKCQGCGILIQSKESEKVGYTPANKINEFLNPVEKKESHLISEIEEELKFEEENNIIIEQDEEEPVNPANQKGNKAEKKEKGKVLLCERCFKLKNNKNFSGKNMNQSKIKKYSNIVKFINKDKLIQKIFSKIPNNCNIYYLFDIFDIESTITPQLIEKIVEKDLIVTFVANKFDVLPEKATDERIRVWIGERLKEILKDKIKKYSYLIISSKTGHNFDYVIHNIKKIKEDKKEFQKPKIYIIGYTNVGKSSFINQLIVKSNRYKMRELKKYDKDVNAPQIVFSESELTSSALPGTTIGITKIQDVNLGVSIFDTPGIPNDKSLSFYMEEMLDVMSVHINKKIKTYSMLVHQGYTIFLGAVAKIDFMNGQDKNFSFFFSHNVTIHKTPMLKSQEIFEKHAGKLLRPSLKQEFKDQEFQVYKFDLKCDRMMTLNYDISISGLGWFSISGKGFCQIEVSVPQNVLVTLRKKPIMPFEIKEKGLIKYYGNTLNKNSKINRKFHNEKYLKKDDNQNNEVKKKLKLLKERKLLNKKL